MVEEAPQYYDIGGRGGYGDNTVVNYENNGNLYGRRCFGRPCREWENKGKLVTAATTG